MKENNLDLFKIEDSYELENVPELMKNLYLLGDSILS